MRGSAFLLANSRGKVELNETEVESSAINVEAINGKVEVFGLKVESANVISGFS